MNTGFKTNEITFRAIRYHLIPIDFKIYTYSSHSSRLTVINNHILIFGELENYIESIKRHFPPFFTNFRGTGLKKQIDYFVENFLQSHFNLRDKCIKI